MLSLESHKDITQHVRTKNVCPRPDSTLGCEGTLMQVVAPLLNIECVGLDLLRRDLFIDAEPGPSGETNRHGFKVVVVTGHTTRLRGEIGGGALKQRQATLNRIRDRIPALRLQSRSGTACASRPGFDQ